MYLRDKYGRAFALVKGYFRIEKLETFENMKKEQNNKASPKDSPHSQSLLDKGDLEDLCNHCENPNFEALQ